MGIEKKKICLVGAGKTMQKHLDVFKSQSNLKRELIIDDYFKFLFDRKIYKFDYFMLDQYVHLGSIKEYQELKYWENYFANVH